MTSIMKLFSHRDLKDIWSYQRKQNASTPTPCFVLHWIFCSSSGICLGKQKKRDPATTPLRHKVQDHGDPYLCRWRVHGTIHVLFRQNKWVWANKCCWSYSKWNTLWASLKPFKNRFSYANYILRCHNYIVSILSCVLAPFALF